MVLAHENHGVQLIFCTRNAINTLAKTQQKCPCSDIEIIAMFLQRMSGSFLSYDFPKRKLIGLFSTPFFALEKMICSHCEGKKLRFAPPSVLLSICALVIYGLGMTKSFHEKFNRKITNSNTRGEISYGKMQYAIYIVFFPDSSNGSGTCVNTTLLPENKIHKHFEFMLMFFPRSFPRTLPKQCFKFQQYCQNIGLRF